MPIQVEHLDAVVRIIDTCTARGAFRGNEMTSVGQLRDAFAQEVQSIVEQAQQSAEEDDGDAVDELASSPEDDHEIDRD